MADSVDGTNTDDWSVAVVDENRMRGEIDAHWIAERWPCEPMTEPETALARLSRSSLVVCVRSKTERETDLVQSIWNVYPHVQILLLLSREELTGPDRNYDEILREPFSRTALQSMVERLRRRARYALKVRQYYRLGGYLMSIEKYASDDMAADADLLTTRIAALRTEIRALAENMDESDFEAVRQSLYRRKQTFERPTIPTGYNASSKYHPPACPTCGLPWGVSHGGDLGEGYLRVAALVWRCTGCGDYLKTGSSEYSHIL